MWEPCCAPRQKFPPPTTSASCTPLSTACAISLARAVVAVGDTPKPFGPARNSPDSLSSARLTCLLTDGDSGESIDLDVLSHGRGALHDLLTEGLLVVFDVGLLE